MLPKVIWATMLVLFSQKMVNYSLGRVWNTMVTNRTRTVFLLKIWKRVKLLIIQRILTIMPVSLHGKAITNYILLATIMALMKFLS